MVKSKTEQLIIDELERLAPTHGVDIVDVEITGATKAPCVRVRLEGEGGASLSLDEVCAQTAWVSDAVEALDPIASPYTLEVSSPGLDRPLRRPSDFMRFQGETCELTTTATEGRRRFKGVIAAATDTSATLELEDGEHLELSYDDIKKCTLKPVFDFKQKEGKK